MKYVRRSWLVIPLLYDNAVRLTYPSRPSLIFPPQRCTGEKPWCQTCKERNKLCIYDNGSFGVRQQEADALLALRRTNKLLPFAGSSIDATLYQELIVLFGIQWDSNSGYWKTARLATSTDPAHPLVKIDYQHGLSQILKMTVDLLVTKSLPFGQRLRVPSATVFSHQNGRAFSPSDNFKTYRSQRLCDYSDNDLLRHREIYELAFHSHPFLSLIVSRTINISKIEDRMLDELCYDSILLAGLDMKAETSPAARDSGVSAHGLPKINDLVERVTSALYGTKPANVKASDLHTHAQCLMILAWRELARGLFRRATTFWTIIWCLLLKIRALREQEVDRTECYINGVEISLVTAEELNNMQAITQLVLLWLELSLGPTPAHALTVSLDSQRKANDTSTSWISELDKRSGNFAAIQGYRRSFVLLCSIECVLDSLTESCDAWTSFSDGRSLQTKQHDDATERTDAILSQARVSQTSRRAKASSKVIPGAALISLTALLACFHTRNASVALRRPPSKMYEQWIANVVKACSSVTLQLRDAFISCASTDSDVTRSEAHETACCIANATSYGDKLNANSVTLTMIEAVALTFELLLSQVDRGSFAGPPGFADEAVWPTDDGCGWAITEKLGCMLGITSTMMDCLESVPTPGKRPGHVLKLLLQLQERLHRLGVQPDISFAFDVDMHQSAFDAVPKARQLKGEGGLSQFNLQGDTSARCYSLATSTFAQTSTSDAQPQAMPNTVDSAEQAQAQSFYPTPPYSDIALPPLPHRPIWYGPGPMPVQRHDASASASSHLRGPASQSIYAIQDRSVAQQQSTHAWDRAGYAAQPYSATRTGCCESRCTPSSSLATGQAEPRSPLHPSHAPYYNPPLAASHGGPPSGHGMRSLPSYSDTELHLVSGARMRSYGAPEDQRPHSQPSSSTSCAETSAEERAGKRFRVHLDLHDGWWTARQEDNLHGSESYGSRQLQNLRQATVPVCWAIMRRRQQEAASRRSQDLPAAEALASIQSMTFLTDEIDASGCSTASTTGRPHSGGRITDLTIVSSSSLPNEEKDEMKETSDEEGDDENSDDEDEDDDDE
ncbi:hypothetical protein PSEUBRA_001747 [Kalmanozyma brasiliensis GHG001]|uniref:uncharacterized protein n=1 Tax=Kalmanozyma brasiliensis (strain GHG001) TaxID=1365824 RepID=UPI0028681D02|nr:uncharacterized protein PSEUBRA_001747 [Kalmanozyma brasiliensis GHG001]EST08671.2 hypothetical protein PSEUBRA_001747 [Kalmanozyma brasiliensis GHG001]